MKGSGSSSVQASGNPLVLVCTMASPSLLIFAVDVVFLSYVRIDNTQLIIVQNLDGCTAHVSIMAGTGCMASAKAVHVV